MFIKTFLFLLYTMAKLKTTNIVLFNTIRDLNKLSSKTGVNVYKAVADKLSSTASQRSEVNLTKINKFAKEGEKIVVPGKVLGNGILSKKVTIIGFKASEGAIKKIEVAGSKFIEIKDYISNKPDSKIRILG